ncbi:hypothetical protein ACP275_02G007100 [Erythranthe tilingii]
MSSAETATKKMIALMSSDGVTFEVEESVAVQSETIKNMIENNIAVTPIPLPNVTSNILLKVIEYCKHHAEAASNAAVYGAAAHKVAEEYVRRFDSELLKVDQSTLIDLLNAAYNLNIKSLVELTCNKVAEMLKWMSIEQIRCTLNAENDFIPE